MAVKNEIAAAVSDSEPRRVTILGSTGSVGCQTIDIIKRNSHAYKVEALTAGSNVKLVAAQARFRGPGAAAVLLYAGRPM